MEVGHAHNCISLTLVAVLQAIIEVTEIVLIARAAREHEQEACTSLVIKVIATNEIRFSLTTTYLGRHKANVYTCER